MKRKIALLLATVMTLSSLSLNAFAASTNRFSRTPGYLPENSLMPQAGSDAERYYEGRTVDGPNDLEYVTNGTDLILELKDTLANRGVFTVELDGAEWYLVASQAALKKVNGVAGTSWTSVFAGVEGVDYNYDGSSNETVNDGVYTKYATGTPGSTAQVGYTLRTSGVDSTRAVVTIDNVKYDGSSNGDARANDLITIPLIIKTTTDGDVKVVVSPGNTTVTGGTYVVGRTSSGNTRTWVDDPETARDTFAVDLYMKETRVNALGNGSFELRLPTGFEWEDPKQYSSSSDTGVRLGLSADLAWNDSLGNRDSWGVWNSDYTIAKKVFKYGTNEYLDEKVLVVTFHNLKKSTSIPGELKIEGLQINAEENAPWGDFNIGVYDETKSVSGVSKDGAGVKEESIKAGTRTDWNISLTASGTIPTLFTGRYESTMETAEDAHHKTAKAIFKENAKAAWWSNRQTVFELPEGVKFRKVDIHDIDDIVDSGSKLEGEYTNTGVKKNVVTVDGRTMTWGSLSVDGKAKVEIDMWVSIESGFEGNIELKATGIGYDNGNNELSCVIAHTQDPIEVTTEVRDVKIGYQYQQTADIVIKETAAGALMKGREVRLAVTDLISTDMYMTAESTPQVEGDIKISNFTNGLNGSAGLSDYLYSYRLSDGSVVYNTNSTNTSASLGTQGDVVFEIQSASSKASTITLKDVAVKVDRNAPETNDRPIKLIVWGTAVAANYGGARDMFATPGIITDYINNVTAADGRSITAEVRVKIGDKYVTVNGIQAEMDAAAYISTDSNSTMVPVRFVANAFGISDDQIIWDGTNKTVTIIGFDKVVQLTAGVTDITVNGSKIAMISPDNKAVSAEIKGEDGHERMYIPFRALGNAFGVPVSWDSASQTAIYNAK